MATGEAAELNGRTIGGHHPGLFTLFFSEMWERFSFYGMRALLTLYLQKGFLGYGDSDAFAVYGSYTALVYMTPFFGGMLADRLIGPRRAVVLGGVLMALGHLLMTVEQAVALFMALGLLVCGNGLFKPNISTLVGSLYKPGSEKRDAGFTIFYMGINLGAAMSSLICGYIGETYGWHFGFGMATIGMLLGVAVFVMPVLLAQLLLAGSAGLFAFGLWWMWLYPESKLPELINLTVSGITLASAVIAWLAFRRAGELEARGPARTVTAAIVLAGAIAAAAWLVRFHPENQFSTAVNYFVAAAMVIAAAVACWALAYGGLPLRIGQPEDMQRLFAPVVPGLPITREWAVFAGSILAVPVLAALVSGFAILTPEGRPVYLIPASTVEAIKRTGGFGEVLATVVRELSLPGGLVLFIGGLGCAIYLGVETFKLDKVGRHRMFAILVLTLFSMLFWAFFEQAGSSLNLFADRNVDRVLERRQVTEADVGKVLEIQPTQENIGYSYKGKPFLMKDLTKLRDEHKGDPNFTIEWPITEEHIGMGIAERRQEIPASVFQSINPIYILIFGLPFSVLWVMLARINLEPSIPVKFALGLLQLGLGFGAIWLGGQLADDRGMVFVGWLLLGYLLHTTGELCLSPVGLSMVTKLSPRHLVSTVMGTWFLATAFSQYLAAIIAQFTGVTIEKGGETVIPPPNETLPVYTDVFGKVGIAAVVAALICFALSPILKRWMHLDRAPTA